jgi:hypothetical protein
VLPSAFRQDVSTGLDAWFRRAFARASGDRFESATQMREALIDACSPLPLVDSSCVRSARTSEVRSRHPHLDGRREVA